MRLPIAKTLAIVALAGGSPATSYAVLGCGQCAVPAPPSGIVICGCPTSGPGQVGIATVTGSIGQQIDVPIQIHTSGPVSSFLIDVEFPGALVQWVSTTRGPLAAPFDFFSSSRHPTLPLIRTVASELGSDYIATGATGTIVVLRFNVIGQGNGTFCFSALSQGISGYSACVATASGVPFIGSDTESVVELGSVTPNPFRNSSRVTFAVSGVVDRHVSVTVYNILGERIRQLFDGLRGPGSHTVVWEGLTDAGELARPGIYFYQVVCGQERRTTSVTFLR